MVARRARAQPLNARRPATWISLALIALTAIAAFSLGRKPGEMRDFEVYWTAAARAAEGRPLYRAEDGHYQFKYLPAFAVLTSPIARVPLESAKRAWFVGSVGLLCVLLSLSLALLPERRRLGPLIIAATIVVMGKFYGHELVLGQVNLLFAAVAAAAIYMLRTGEVMASSLLFVAAVVIKPYALVFLPWVVVLHGRRTLLPLVLGSAVVVALPAVLYGIEGTIDLHRQWWRTVTQSTAPNLTNADNVSLAGFFAKWLGQGPSAAFAAALASAAIVAVLAVAVWRGGRIRGREALEGCVLLILVPLLSPQGWDYVFLIATPAVALLVNYARDLPGAWRAVLYVTMATIGLSLFDLLGRERYAMFMAWSILTPCFVILLAALAEIRRREIA